MSTASTTSPDELRKRALELRWYHSIDLGEGVVTPGVTPLEVAVSLAEIYFGDDVRGKSVLDIGCWDGFNSIEALHRGARDVLATDHFAWHSSSCWGNRECIEIARSLVAPEMRVEDIDLADLSVKRVGQFDTVLFAGVFYHLRHPLPVLEKVARMVGETLILETHLDARDIDRPAMIFYPGRELAGDSTNWWGPNEACVEAMLADVGFKEVRFTPHPIEPDTRGIFHARR
jgi:tRNA (mo5U34)-methyltransferase